MSTPRSEYRLAWFREFGRLTVNFSQLDAHLDRIIWGLSLVPDDITGWILTTNMPFRNKVEVCRALVDHRDIDQEDKEDILRFLEKAKELSETRNLRVHAVYSEPKQPDEKTMSFAARLQDGIFTLHKDDVTPEILSEEADRMAEWGERGRMLRERIAAKYAGMEVADTPG